MHQIMHQNVAVILRHLCYGEISFGVLVPDENCFRKLDGRKQAGAGCSKGDDVRLHRGRGDVDTKPV